MSLILALPHTFIVIDLEILSIAILLPLIQEGPYSFTSQFMCTEYGKCSKISNTLKLRTPKIIAENNF